MKIIHAMHLKEPTKRIVLSVVASFFDPLGYFFSIPMQENTKWDDIILPEISESRKKFVDLITAIKAIRIKRFVVPEPN